MSKPVDWTGITDLYNRSAYDIKKDGTYVFPTHPKRLPEKETKMNDWHIGIAGTLGLMIVVAFSCALASILPI